MLVRIAKQVNIKVKLEPVQDLDNRKCARETSPLALIQIHFANREEWVQGLE